MNTPEAARAAASPAHCSQSVTITIRTAVPTSRKKVIAQNALLVNGDVAALTGLVSLEQKRSKKHDGRDHTQKPVHFDVREGYGYG